MNKHLLLVCFLFVTILTSGANKEGYYFRQLNTENGLSQNTVLSILQDQKGFMWFGTKNGLNKYDGNNIKIYKWDANDPQSLGNNAIWALHQSEDGNIWVGTEKGIYIYDYKKNSFSFFNIKTPEGRLISGWVVDIKQDKYGKFWFVSDKLYCYSPNENTLKMLDVKSSNNISPQPWGVYLDNDYAWLASMNGWINKYDVKTFAHKELKDNETSIIDNSISEIYPLNNNFLLIGSFDNGVKLMNKKSNKIHQYNLESNQGKNLFVRTINIFSDENIWIGTESGLYIHNPVTGETTGVFHNVNDKYSLSDNAIYSAYEDKEGGIWIGTYFGGLNYYSSNNAHFKIDYPISGVNSIKGERISGICEDNSGNIWIGTEDNGFNKLNPENRTFQHFSANMPNGLSYNNVHDIVADGELLWIGTFSHGINLYNTKTNQWKYYRKEDKRSNLNNNDIFAIYKDHSDKIWIGTSSGGLLFDKLTDKFIVLKELDSHFISDITEDGNGNIWFSTYDNGAYRYNVTTKAFTNFPFIKNDPNSICHYKITSMFLDKEKQLWFASETQGICMYDAKNNTFIRYGTKDGLPNEAVYNILEDDNSTLWLSSSSGLISFNPNTKDVRIFTQENGLPTNQFNYKSAFKDKSGLMYFGSVKGLVTFRPSAFKQNNIVPPVIITDFNLLNDSTNWKIDDNVIIELSNKQSSFKINFAALSYIAPEINRYAYKMEGLDDDWNYIQKAKEITYSNLPPGKYRFMVKGSNNDGLWNEAGDTLEIIIYPPLWQSNWAYIIYVLLCIFTLYSLVRFAKKRIEQKNIQKQFLFENKKEKEIYNAKIEFFTNIAHEIRTPLTLIKGPLDYILNTDVDKDALGFNLQIMERNTDRLLLLINQLLDFRKTEADGFRLSFRKTDIKELIKTTCTRFKPLIEQKNISFSLCMPEDDIIADVDKEAITKVISNLLTNAIKYGEKKISLTVDKFNNVQFIIRINNDGSIIPKTSKDKIFEPFYRLRKDFSSGSGIGLALVESLVSLHHGRVFLDTNIEDENSFVIYLSYKQRGAINIPKEESVIEENKSENNIHPDNQDILPNDKAQVLCVEDNEELLKFIFDKLKTTYTIFCAKDGVEAIEILNKQIINVVVSDIVMPNMDGLELCSHIKNNPELSHIPIILLTTQTNVQSKIKGLDSGADAYLEKPFTINHLEAQIENLLDNRKKIREAFARSPFIPTKTIARNKADVDFMNFITDIIHNNMADVDFNVDKLALLSNMSRSSLLRKIKGISEFSPNDFIKLLRLKKAAEMLRDGEYRINEICFLIGFSSTSYFTKAFYKQFGILPKDFMKQNNK